MRSRLSLFLNELALDEILYIEEELDRRKEKYRRNYAVLAVHTDKPIMRPDHTADLNLFTREMRRYISSSAAVGGGTVLAFSPEVSVLLFNSINGANRACSALLSNLPEFNGRFARLSLRVGIKMGMASGTDTLAPGSPRCVRGSVLVRRANQIAWRSTANTLLMDENSYLEWPEKFSVMVVPFDVEGQHVYRLMPGMLDKENSKYDNESLMRFLRQVTDAGIQTLKYDMLHIDTDAALAAKWGKHCEAMQVLLEAYDPKTARNMSLKEAIPAVEAPDRMDMVKRVLSSMGIALVRHEVNVATGV